MHHPRPCSAQVPCGRRSANPLPAQHRSPQGQSIVARAQAGRAAQNPPLRNKLSPVCLGYYCALDFAGVRRREERRRPLRMAASVGDRSSGSPLVGRRLLPPESRRPPAGPAMPTSPALLPDFSRSFALLAPCASSTPPEFSCPPPPPVGVTRASVESGGMVLVSLPKGMRDAGGVPSEPGGVLSAGTSPLWIPPQGIEFSLLEAGDRSMTGGSSSPLSSIDSRRGTGSSRLEPAARGPQEARRPLRPVLEMETVSASLAAGVAVLAALLSVAYQALLGDDPPACTRGVVRVTDM